MVHEVAATGTWSTELHVPQRLVEAIIFLRGHEDGNRWLEGLPQRIDRQCRMWDLKPTGIAEGGAMSCCVFCTTKDGQAAVLKIPVDVNAGRLEARALAIWTPGGASPRVLQSSSTTGIFLMERVVPGSTPQPVNGGEDSAKFINLLERMTVNSPQVKRRFVDVSVIASMRLDWAQERFQDDQYATSITPIDDARKLLSKLIQTTPVRIHLHGDLQPKNILCDAHGNWLAIDPLPCIGDINSEAALWATMQDCPTTIQERLQELNVHPLLSPSRLQAWAYIFAVAELRPYLPLMAARMGQFISEMNSEVIKFLKAR